MNELTEGILQLSYSPAINVYIVWILGFAFIYKMNSLLKKSVDELTEEEKERYTGAGVIKDGLWKERYEFGLREHCYKNGKWTGYEMGRWVTYDSYCEK